jgi:pentatricopeptide repeat protein
LYLFTKLASPTPTRPFVKGLKDYGMVVDAAARCGNLTAAEFWFQEAEAAGIQPRILASMASFFFCWL